MAAAMANNSDGLCSGREQRGEGRELRGGGRCRASRGVRGALGCFQRWAGKQEVAARRCARVEHTFVLLAEEEDDREKAVVGWAG